MLKYKNICILGGSGFVGQHIVSKLSKSPVNIKVISRHRERHRDLLVMSNVKVVSADVHDPQVLKDNFVGQDAVINLVGILNSSGKQTFQHAHIDLAKKVVEACQMKGVTRLLHMSALNANPETGPSQYLKSKGAAEKIVHLAHNIDATSFKPSVIFGPGDSFFNRFACLLKMTPAIFPFPLACAAARFAPVYVEDVATAFVSALENKETFGCRYELCGPRQYTLKELVQYTANVSGHHRRIIPLGKTLSKLQGHVMGLWFGKPFTVDNYLSTTVDSVCRDSFPEIFAIKPVAIESIVPHYIGSQNSKGKFSRYRKLARRET